MALELVDRIVVLGALLILGCDASELTPCATSRSCPLDQICVDDFCMAPLAPRMTDASLADGRATDAWVGDADRDADPKDALVDAEVVSRGQIDIRVDRLRFAATARFFETPARSGNRFGACMVFPTGSVPVAEPDPSRHAGDIVFQRPGADPLLVLSPRNNRKYRVGLVEMGIPPGGRLLISAEGDAIPGFSTELRVAGPATLESRLGSRHNANQDLPLQWTAPQRENTIVSFRVTNEGQLRMVCQFPGDFGAGVVPAAALGELPTFDTLVVSMDYWQVEELELSGWRLKVNLSNRMVRPDGSNLEGAWWRLFSDV